MFSYHWVWGDSNVTLMAIAVLLLIVLFVIARKAANWRKPFVIITILYNAVYLIWRALYTLPISLGLLSVILGILLLLAECIGFLQSTVYRLLFLKNTRSSRVY